MDEYPEHEKLKAVPDDVRMAVGDWIETHVIAEWGCPHGVIDRNLLYEGGWDCEVRSCWAGKNDARLWESRLSTQDHMADIFGINYRALMAEKDAMLAAMRAAGA